MFKQLQEDSWIKSMIRNYLTEDFQLDKVYWCNRIVIRKILSDQNGW